mgnify:CR=1 FL=1
MKNKFTVVLVLLSLFVFSQEKTSARKWIDQVLFSVKWDSQGPTIQSRNIYHLTLAMYEAWAFYHPNYKQSFLGKKSGDFLCEFDSDFDFKKMNPDSASEVALNQAAFYLMFHRWSRYSSKNRGVVDGIIDLADSLGVDKSYSDDNYKNGSPESLGIYIAKKIMEFGLQDGSNEENDYERKTYIPANDILRPNVYGANGINDINRWQPIRIREYLKTKGEDKKLPVWYKIVTSDPDDFLSPEWGDVTTFTLTKPKVILKEGHNYKLYLDPGSPPLMDYDKDSLASESYKWGFVLNILWSSHMDPTDGVMMDISPKSLGGVPEYPNSFQDYHKFYDLNNGWTKKIGDRKKNPKTGKVYKKNIVPRGDFTRVIAEYWVDGVFTYSPPGHWFQHLSETSYSAGFVRKWEGKGAELSQIEWDVKSYFTLGGALFDAGIASWGAKGYYDYVRPISAIRLMAEFGQCSDSSLTNYDKRGLPLIPGHIEVVGKNDSLAGLNGEHVGKLKLYTWRGPDYINNAEDDFAGVGWILAGNWWPYQRYSFVTPPFAGYVSGHSTFSSCGAEVIGKITGDPYFTGGLKEITFKKDSFLEFEKGPSVDVTLQWATYHDAANETCLSRIWGGIHPPADDVPGRVMGIKAANLAISKVNGLVVK